MQDPTSITTATFTHLQNPQFPEQEQLKCPRCDSNNTKFCYYNNYNLSQPRHYCKSCRRYWTKGGALRNIPIGGGTRKTTKRSSSSSSSAAQTQLPASSGKSPGLGQNSTKPVPTEEVRTGLVLPSPTGGRELKSLLGMASEGQFGDYLNGLKLGQSHGPGQNMGLELIQGNSGSTSIIGGVQNGDQSCWAGSSNNGLSNLAIYTQPGAKFQ